MRLFKGALSSNAKRTVRIEIAKGRYSQSIIALYVYVPIFLYWSFNTDFFQDRYFIPYLKDANPELYKMKTGLDPKADLVKK